MAPVRTKRIALVSTRIPNYPHRKKDGGGSGGGSGSGPQVHDIVFDGPALITEGAAAGTVVAGVSSLPPEAELTLVNDAGGRFALEDGVLIAGATPTDYEAATQHTVVIRGALGASALDKPLVVSVVNLVELVDFDLTGLTVREDAAQGAVVGVLSSDPTGAAFTLTNTAGGRFALSGSNVVRGATALDYEAATSHDITISAALGGEVINKTFTIQVTDVDELTSFALSANTIAENSPAGTAVGTLSSVPAGATFTLVNNAGNRFALTGGAQIVAGSVATDYESATSHQITARATRLGETIEQNFTINVTNVNELTNITLSAATVVENTGPGVTVGALASVPPGAAFALTDNAGNRFAVSGSNLVTGAVSTNYEAATSHNVTVEATRGADVITRSFTVNVTDVVEPLSIDLAPASIAENSPQGALVGTLTSDPAGATYTLTDSAASRFALAGDTIVVGTVLTDFETAASHTITVDAELDGVETSRTFTITVTDVAELTDIALSNTTVAENIASGGVVGALTSTPGGATWTLVDNAGSRFAITGGNVVRGATALDYEAATSHNITVRGTRGGETLEKTFTITVTNVVEISDITLSANTTPENSVAPAVVGALTSTPAGASFIMTNNAGNRFALSGSNVVRGATALDYENATAHDVTIRGTRQGETFDKTFTINVTNVNEITDITLTPSSVAESIAQGATIGALTSVPAGASFALLDTVGGRFNIVGTNLVRGATALDYENATSHPVQVQATLGPDTFNKTLTVTVTNVSELTAINLSANTIAENSVAGTVVGGLTSTPAGATFTMTGNAGNRFALSGNNVVAGSVSTDYEAATSHEVTIQGARGGETLNQTFTINVTDVVETVPQPEESRPAQTDIMITQEYAYSGAPDGDLVGVLLAIPKTKAEYSAYVSGVTYTLLDDAGGRFKLATGSSHSRQLLAGPTATNDAVATEHSITVRAEWGAGAYTREQTFVLSVRPAGSMRGGTNQVLAAGTANPTATANGSSGTAPYTHEWTMEASENYAIQAGASTAVVTLGYTGPTPGFGWGVTRAVTYDSAGKHAWSRFLVIFSPS
ncbi:hypothetical protein DOMOVOI_03240 [Brevundimonas phage vB_BpoS-Domovoi]|uniref:Cadherin domain-containing protein n=1 Tax=Brevundimonas phage vB_BpoS-Domovoi TaxID=2948598 RepID=A0A9E7SJT3_9CAUD|nr:hypothetical protein DOMOVOI_03240 [Brevundimonas phage vB_BpoS-Domovoi]